MERCQNEFESSKSVESLPRMREDGNFEGQKRSVTRKDYERLPEEFEVGGFFDSERTVQHCQEENVGRQRSSTQRRWATG